MNWYVICNIVKDMFIAINMMTNILIIMTMDIIFCIKQIKSSKNKGEKIDNLISLMG